MKFNILAFLLFVFCYNLSAHEPVSNNTPQKTTIFLSGSFGASASGIKDNFALGTYRLSGLGLQLDLEAGFALSKSLFMHFTFINNLLSNPEITVPRYYQPRSSDEISMQDRLIGGGFTFYPIKEFYFSASAGPGYFYLKDKVNSYHNEYTDMGLAFQLKAGREWRISKKVGMGISCTYGRTWSKNMTDSGEEELKSNRFGFLWSTTLH